MTHYPGYLLARIRDAFADLFPQRGDVLALLAEAEIPAQSVHLEQDAAAVWDDAVREAAKLARVRALLEAALRRYESGPAHNVLSLMLEATADADAVKKNHRRP